MADSDWYQDEIAGVLNQTLFNKQQLIDKFGWEEYLIFALMLAISAAIGIYYWKKGVIFEKVILQRILPVFAVMWILKKSFFSNNCTYWCLEW